MILQHHGNRSADSNTASNRGPVDDVTTTSAHTQPRDTPVDLLTDPATADGIYALLQRMAHFREQDGYPGIHPDDPDARSGVRDVAVGAQRIWSDDDREVSTHGRQRRRVDTPDGHGTGARESSRRATRGKFPKGRSETISRRPTARAVVVTADRIRGHADAESTGDDADEVTDVDGYGFLTRKFAENICWLTITRTAEHFLVTDYAKRDILQCKSTA